MKAAPELPAADGPQESDGETIARLASLPPMEYDRRRKEEARTLGIQVRTLDDLVRAARNEGGAIDRLPFAEVEPCPEPINPALVLDEVSDLIQTYVVLEKEQADALALWTAMTWVIDDVEVAPLAIITAPEKACGKSQLLEVIARIAARPLSAANLSAPFLFRAIEAWRPTLLIDEADTFIRESDELKGLLNAGHTRANAYVGRTVVVGDDHVPRLFDVWGAKAFAGIALEKHLPDSTLSRGIVINLRRKLQHETISRLRHADRSVFSVIAAKLARFAEDYWQQIRQARPTLPDELNDRAQDNWEPLLAIAGCAGPEWVQRANVAAVKLSGAAEISESTGNQLLADIQHVFEAKRVEKISTVDLIAALTADDEKSWAAYNRGKPISPRQLARYLAGYGIKSKTVRFHSSTPKGFEVSQFTDAFARYLAAPGNLPQRRNDTQEANGDIDLRVSNEPQRAPSGQEAATQKPMPGLDGDGAVDETPIPEVADMLPTGVASQDFDL